MDGLAFLAACGRRCPDCGQCGLIGNGHRRRTFRTQPVRRKLLVPQTLAYRVLCKLCRHCHTVLPPPLGPHKRYVLPVIEEAVRRRGAGQTLARISGKLGGVSTERVAAWYQHLASRLDALQKAAEDLLRRDPLFNRPDPAPGEDVFAYLQGLLGTVPLTVLMALNLCLCAHLPLTQLLAAHPPTSSWCPRTPCRSTAAGGVPDG